MDWDDLLFAGSAAYYARGRLPYPPELADALARELGLDGRGRLLDVGCGPGSLTLLLTPLFEQAIGVDADADMISAARREAARIGLGNAEFLVLRAEALPAGLGMFRVVAFAQSFHWMDRDRVAATVRDMLEPEGVWVHVNAKTHQGVGGDEDLPASQPPRDEISELVKAYLGPEPRAGRVTLRTRFAEHGGTSPSGEEDVMRAAGFRGPRRIDAAGERVLERSEDDVVASVFSVSGAAPHL
jgi:SAM-dependent methyltransferase